MKISYLRRYKLNLVYVSITEYKYSTFFRTSDKFARIVQISRNNYHVYVCDCKNDYITHFTYNTYTKCLEKVSDFFNCT